MTSRHVLGDLNASLNQARGKRKHEDCLNEPPLTKKGGIKSIENRPISKKFKSNIKYEKPSEPEDKLVNELTPCSTLISSTTCRATLLETFTTPLPHFKWANSSELWHLMQKNDKAHKRDSNLFNRHPSINPMMRATLLDWLGEVCQAYTLTRQTYYLAIDLFDRYLSSQEDIPKRRLQLLGITCLFLAAKTEEIFPPKVDRFAFVCDGACTEKEILSQEMVLLNTVNWEVNSMTPITWLNLFMQIYATMDKENTNCRQVDESYLLPVYQTPLFVQIAHLIDLCMLNAGSLSFPYSVIAASAVYHFTNENIVSHCTGKSVPEMHSCIEWMIPFAIAIKHDGLEFVNKLDEEHATTIQNHTVSLDLLKSAQSIQAEIESEKMNHSLLESSDNGSVCSDCPLTPTKLTLTPPRSGST